VVPPPPPPPPPPAAFLDGMPGAWIAPPPPPPIVPPFGPHQHAFTIQGPPHFPPYSMPPFPPNLPPSPPTPPPRHGEPFPSAGDMDVDLLDGVEHAEVTMYGAVPRMRQQSQNTKEALQAAKELYKSEKERYRNEREERKRERERRRNMSGEDRQLSMDSSKDASSAESPTKRADAPAAEGQVSSPSANAPPHTPTQIISNARGPYPQLEMYSIPRRSHTVHGTGHHRQPSDSRDGPLSPSETAAAREIINKLSEMGFTSTLYPNLASKVNARVPRNERPMSQETEDSIVTEILEELLQASPVSPGHASGSTPAAPGLEAHRLTRNPSLP